MSAGDLRWRAVLALVAAWGGALRLLAVLRTDTESTRPPLMDDSFYYFSLGRNLAAGAGPRIDAEHVTTGFQPLWGFLSALACRILPQEEVTGVQLLGVIVGLGTIAALSVLVASLSGSRLAGLAAASLWATAPPAIAMSVNGMETGLAVLMAVLLLLVTARMLERPSASSAAAAGLVCGTAILARVDLLLLVAGAGLALLRAEWSANGLRRTERSAEGMRRAAIFTGCCLLPVLPWLVFTTALGKPPLPESGAAVRLIASLMEPAETTAAGTFLREAGRFAGRAASDLWLLLPFDPSLPRDAGAEGPTLPAFLAAALLGAMWSLARTRLQRQVLGVWTIGAALATAGYAGGNGAEWFYERYALPFAETFMALAVALAASGLAVAPPPARRWLHRGAALYVAATFGCFAYLAAADDSFTWLRDSGREPTGYVRTSRWLDAHVAPHERVGVFQSGYIGWRAAMPVVNLDGKVNAAARRAMEQGRMWEYVCAQRLDYIADWPFLIHRLLVLRSAAWRDDNLEVVARIPRGDGNSEWVIARVSCPR